MARPRVRARQSVTTCRRRMLQAALLLAACAARHAFALDSKTSIFSPAATPAKVSYDLSLFVLTITGGIFVTVASLIFYAAVRFRRRPDDDGSEPPQIFGSNQIELSWTIIPVLIVVVMFLATARMIFAIQDAPQPPSALEVTVIGHQFWWEFGYRAQHITTANELHIPVSETSTSRPTFMKLTSADVIHAFWIPRLSGKVDLLPNRINEMWMDPHTPGMYVGQCAQFCGVEHAKMLLRVYVQTPEDFAAWVKTQQQPAVQDPAVAEGRQIFESQSCVSCHVIRGTPAQGRFGPDLTHFGSRDTLASGAADNTPANLKLWIKDPDYVK